MGCNWKKIDLQEVGPRSISNIFYWFGSLVVNHLTSYGSFSVEFNGQLGSVTTTTMAYHCTEKDREIHRERERECLTRHRRIAYLVLLLVTGNSV